MSAPRFGHGRKYDAAIIRKLITTEIRRSKKTREQIADRMSKLLGLAVTARMITAFTSESKELHRWPAEFTLAFCEAVGSYRLLSEQVKRAGFRMIGPKEERLIVIGAAYERKLAAEAILAAGGQ